MSAYSYRVRVQSPRIASRASPASVVLQQRLRDRAGERQGDQGDGRRSPEQRREAGRDDPLRALAGEVVEAQDRLDDAEPDDDARRDHRGEHHLCGAVVARGQVVRVDRQQEDRDQLRHHAGGRVRGPGRGQPAQVLEHLDLEECRHLDGGWSRIARGARAPRSPTAAGAAAGSGRLPDSPQRDAQAEQRPGRRVDRERRVAEAVDDHRREAGGRRRARRGAARRR